MYQGDLNENCNIYEKTIMHGYRTSNASNGGDLNQNDKTNSKRENLSYMVTKCCMGRS